MSFVSRRPLDLNVISLPDVNEKLTPPFEFSGDEDNGCTLELAVEVDDDGGKQWSCSLCWKSILRNNLLFKLGLLSSADSFIGDAKVRGISGGEKKRLSLGCELIASPSVIFADEPTTGLDSFQAEKVMETLHQLAQDGHTVIYSIHQPRGSVYGKFDDIVLLTECALVYTGPARDESLEYFSRFGYQCPDHANPAEFLADLISIDYCSADSVYSSQKRIDALVEAFSTQSSVVLYATPLSGKTGARHGMKFSKKTVSKRKGGWWRQFWLLLKRAWMQALICVLGKKVGHNELIQVLLVGEVGAGELGVEGVVEDFSLLNMQVIVAPVGSSISLGGSTYAENWLISNFMLAPPMSLHPLPMVAAINTAMAALTTTGGVFPKERAIVNRECAKGSYALGPYLLSKLIAEIPVGAAFPLMFGAVLYPMARLHPTLSGSFS
ncbi:hypothetical protein REPUB_Repub01dG0065700 [Reevesia pubescens]